MWWWALILLGMANTCREPPAKKMKDTEVSGEDSGLSDDLIVVEVRLRHY